MYPGEINCFQLARAGNAKSLQPSASLHFEGVPKATDFELVHPCCEFSPVCQHEITIVTHPQ